MTMLVGQNAGCRYRIEAQAIHIEHLPYLGCICWEWQHPPT
jgi:hypothetical protein